MFRKTLLAQAISLVIMERSKINLLKQDFCVTCAGGRGPNG